MSIKIEGQVSVETKKATQDLQKWSRDTGKELDKATLIKLEVDLASLKLAKKEAQKELRELQKGYEEGLIPQSSVIEAQRALDSISSKTTEAGRELRNYRNTGEKGLSRLGALFQSVNDEIKQSRDELVRLGKSTKVLDKFDNEVNRINKEFKEGKVDIKQYKDEIGKLETELKNTGSGFDNLIGKVGKLGGFLAGGAVAAGFAGVVGFVGDLDTALRKLENQTGLTGVELESLQDSFIDLENTGLGTLQENVKTIANLNKELGLTGEELSKVAIGTTAIANNFEKDVNETLRATTALVKNFGLSGSEANDLITKSLQTTGDTYDDILDSINEYSAIASDAKIPVQDFINVLLNGTKAGIRNTDELADAQREFAIRLRDGSKTSKEAFDTLGLSYDDFQNKITTGEITVGESMREIAKRIQAIEDPILRTQIGTDLLGTKFEDNGDIILDVLANVEDLLGDVEGANQKLVDNSETGLKQFSNGWNSFVLQIKKLILPFINELGGQFGKLFNFLGTLVAKGVDAIDFLGKSFGTGLIAIGESISNLVKFSIDNFKALTNNIGIAFGNIPALAQDGLNQFLGILTNTVNKAIGLLNKLPKVNLGNLSAPSIDLFDTKQFQEVDFKFNFSGTKTATNEASKSFNNLIGKTKEFKAEIKDLEDVLDGGGGDGGAEPVVIKNLNSLYKKLSDFKNKLGNAELGSGEFKKLQKEISQTEKEIKKYTETTKKTGTTTKKTAEEIIKTEQEKQDKIKNIGRTREDIEKDLAEKVLKLQKEKIENQEKLEMEALNNRALLQIEAINQSNRTEGEKARGILEINEKLQKDLSIIGETELEKSKRLAQERIQQEQDYSKTVEGIFEKAGNIQEDYRKKLEEVGEEFEKLKDTALENIDAINSSLEDLETETDTKLAERRVKLLEDEKKIQEELANLKQDGSDFEKRNELLQDQIALQKELSLIEQNASQEVLKAVEERSKLSDSERILADAEIQKAILEERKSINEAIANGEEILLDEIQNKKNLALAEELIARRDNLNNELEIVKQNYNEEIKALEETDEYKRRIQKDYTDFVKGEVNKQIAEYNRLRDAARSAAAAARSAGVSNQTTTNNNLNQNINVSNEVDSQSLIREINKSLK